METKKIITPFGNTEVEIKSWITGKDFDEIQKPITDISVDIDTAGLGKGKVNLGESQRQSVKKSIEIVVVKIDGKATGIVETVYNMRKEDFDFVLKEIDKVIKGESFTEPSKTA